MQPGDLVIVRCPVGFANRTLQNSIGRLVSRGGWLDVHHVFLLTGPEAGKTWQFIGGHLKLARANPGVQPIGELHANG